MLRGPHQTGKKGLSLLSWILFDPKDKGKFRIDILLGSVKNRGLVVEDC